MKGEGGHLDLHLILTLNPKETVWCLIFARDTTGSTVRTLLTKAIYLYAYPNSLPYSKNIPQNLIFQKLGQELEEQL